MSDILNREDIRSFYNRFGKRLDKPVFYEGKAMELLASHGIFDSAHSIIEFGCGTGRLAEQLFLNYLPEDCIYLGIDSSSTMVELARKRLHPWQNRAKIRLSDGRIRLDCHDRTFDRFISTYVFDLLAEEDVRLLIKEAHRVLKLKGLLCTVNLTPGEGILPGIVTRFWQIIHKLNPILVGGCRPIRLLDFLTTSDWHMIYRKIVTSYGVSSEIIIASQSPRK